MVNWILGYLFPLGGHVWTRTGVLKICCEFVVVFGTLKGFGSTKLRCMGVPSCVASHSLGQGRAGGVGVTGGRVGWLVSEDGLAKNI